MNRLYDRMRGSGGRWRKPQGAEWFILGRDQAKFLPARSSLGKKRPGFGSVAGCLGGSRTVVKVGEATDGTPTTAVKHEPGRRGKPLENGSSRRFLVQVDDESGNTKRATM